MVFQVRKFNKRLLKVMHFAFNEKESLLRGDILKGIDQIIPLSQIDPERTKQLQDWALSGRVRLAS